MTQYTVVWLNDALNELAQIWLDAIDREAISSAAHLIDQQLSEEPKAKGAYLSESLWRFEALPLSVYFTVRDADRQVEISNVVASTTHRRPFPARRVDDAFQ